MSLVWGSQFVFMLFLAGSHFVVDLHTWCFTCLPIVIFSASIGRFVCAVAGASVCMEVLYRCAQPFTCNHDVR
jgi:hypothetical protein